jgi:hypothetical protein
MYVFSEEGKYKAALTQLFTTFPATCMVSIVGLCLPPRGSIVTANVAAPDPMSFILWRPVKSLSKTPASTGLPSMIATTDIDFPGLAFSDPEC